MTQTIAKFKRDTQTVEIYADYGQGRTRLAKTFYFEQTTLNEILTSLTDNELIEESSLHDLNGLSRLKVWRVCSDSGCGGAEGNLNQRYFLTKKEAIQEAMSQFC